MLVKQLVDLHHGSVRAASDGLACGSEFVVRLPWLEEEGAARGALGTNGVAVDERARRVLIVDDDVDAAESLAILLCLDGHDVTLAHDGAAAVDAARRAPPAAALTRGGRSAGSCGG